MANYVLQYDLNLNCIDNNGIPRSTVYAFVTRYLNQRGFQRYQQSFWRADNIILGPIFFNFVVAAFANALEIRFGVGVFRHLHYEQRFNFVTVR